MICNPKIGVMFSPNKNKWILLPKLPLNECFNNVGNESFSVDDNEELLVFGREIFQFVIWKYSLRSRIWIKCEGMHRPRWIFASGSLGGVAIVAGGIDMGWNILSSAETYDSSTGRWEMLPNMHSPRKHGSGFFMDGKFYVIGGMLTTNVLVTCGEVFNLGTRKWRKIEGMYPHMNPTWHIPPSFAVVNDELFMIEYRSYIMKKYDKGNNKWEIMGRLAPMVNVPNVWTIAFKACGDQLFVFCLLQGCNGKDIVVISWCPKSGAKDGNLDWKVVGFKENFGDFLYNSTVMGC